MKNQAWGHPWVCLNLPGILVTFPHRLLLSDNVDKQFQEKQPEGFMVKIQVPVSQFNNAPLDSFLFVWPKVALKYH